MNARTDSERNYFSPIEAKISEKALNWERFKKIGSLKKVAIASKTRDSDTHTSFKMM